MNKVMFSSNSDAWATPDAVFETLDQEFNFTLDACATQENHKCEKYYTKKDDGLRKNWGGSKSILQPTI
jgi:site-specific DNA-methyltransferase (adenine-specific)